MGQVWIIPDLAPYSSIESNNRRRDMQKFQQRIFNEACITVYSYSFY